MEAGGAVAPARLAYAFAPTTTAPIRGIVGDATARFRPCRAIGTGGLGVASVRPRRLNRPET